MIELEALQDSDRSTTSAAVQPAVSGWRIAFVSQPPDGSTVLMEFADPQRRFAICAPVEVDRLPEAGLWPEAADHVHFLYLVTGAASFEEQKRAEAWMARPPFAEARPTIEVLLRSERVLWRPGRALLFGAADRMADNLAAIVDFAFHEGELRRLEQEVAADWPRLEADADLGHQVKGSDLRRTEQVNAITKATALRRMRFARLEPRLDRVSLGLEAGARRIVAELSIQGEVEDRLQALDDSLEVFEDHYQTVNERLSELSLYRRELFVEGWIVALLFTEVMLLIWQTVVLRGGQLGG
jgi:hypothetical protein